MVSLVLRIAPPAEIVMSRTLVARGGYGAAERRIIDLLAHSVAASAFARHEVERSESIVAFFKSLEQVALGPADDAQAGALGEELRRLLRKQARIFAGAQLIVDQRGSSAAKAVLKLAAKKKGLLNTRDLQQRFPEIAGWLESTE